MSSIKGKKILWAEDDKFMTSLLSKKLLMEGAVLTLAADGERANELIQAEKFDAVILDILLPKLDGLEILRRMKADDTKKDTPVMLLSNLGQKSDIERGKALGADKYLVKVLIPIDEIVDEVEKLFEK